MDEREWLDIFSNNLREVMREKGYTQRDLSYATGLSEATISAYLNNRKLPGIKAIINIAYELNLTVDDLVDFGYRIR